MDPDLIHPQTRLTMNVCMWLGVGAIRHRNTRSNKKGTRPLAWEVGTQEWGSFPRVMLAGRAVHPLASDHTPVRRKWCPGPTFISAFLTICDPTLPLIAVPYLLLGMPLVTCTRVLLAENVWEVVKKILETGSQQRPFLPMNVDKQARVRVSNARDST